MTKIVQKNQIETVSVIKLTRASFRVSCITLALTMPWILRIVAAKRKLTAKSATIIESIRTGKRMRLLIDVHTALVWRTNEASIVTSSTAVSKTAATLLAYAEVGIVP